jgi:hypothetical protein
VSPIRIVVFAFISLIAIRSFALDSGSAKPVAVAPSTDSGPTPTTSAAVPTVEGKETRFESFGQKWLVQGLLEFPVYSFYLGAPAVQGIAYLPNFSPKLGSRIYYERQGLTVTFPLPPQETARRGNSTQTSFVISPYFRDFAMDLYYQYYRGFYEDNPLTELNPDKPDRYPQLPDATVTNFGINTYFNLDPTKYSMRAAFNLVERQKESGGTWLLKPFYNHLSISTGGRFIPGSSPSSPQTGPALASGSFNTLGSGLGYGYIIVRGKYFISGQAIAGLGGQYQQIDVTGGGQQNQMALAVNLNANMAAGYNGDIHVAGIKLLVDSLSARVQDVEFSSTLASGQVFYGARF